MTESTPQHEPTQPLPADWVAEAANQPVDAALSATWQPESDEIAPPAKQRVIKDILETVLMVVLLFFVMRGLIQNFRIEGSSMSPTMHTQQYILVNKAIYLHFDVNAPLRLLPGRGDLPAKMIYPFHPPERGDIVVFHAPVEAHDEPDKDYIKRVIGVAGDAISVRDGGIWLNGVRLNEDAYLTNVVTSCQRYCELRVPSGYIFVMGDNRSFSSDSRSWGLLPLENVVGKAWFSYWPRASWESY